jgi:hypothetical protein
MKNEDLDKLISTNQSTCLSITIPMDRINKKANIEMLKKATQRAKMLLKNSPISHDLKEQLQKKLLAMTTHLPERIFDGIGFFISADHSFTVPFPFSVKSKVVLDDSFEIRDLLYLKQYATPYFVLNLSKKGVHFYHGILDELIEIKNDKFPLLYEDQFEYERASISNSSSSALKSFERDKNQISEMRLKTVFHEADAHLKHYLSNDKNLLLAGTQKMIALFTGVASSKKSIAGKISGSFKDTTLNKLSQSAWEMIIRSRNTEISKQIEKMKEQRNGLVAEGLQQAWSAATEGKGLVLMVEKDLHHRAYLRESENTLHLQPPRKPYGIVADAVDELIETVQSKNGKVIFTDNGQLKTFNHLALQLRY